MGSRCHHPTSNPVTATHENFMLESSRIQGLDPRAEELFPGSHSIVELKSLEAARLEGTLIEN